MRNFAGFIVVVLALAWTLGSARNVPARIVLPDGSEQMGTFVCLKSDTVFYTVTNGDSIQAFALYKFDVKKVQLTEDNSLVDLSLSNFQVNSEAPKDTTKSDEPTLKVGRAVLVVTSDPADARVYVDNVLVEGLTPLVIPNLEAKKFHVMARKYLRGVDWWGSKRVLTKEGDTTRITIKLLKPHTQLSIQSLPTEAEVYIDEMPSLSKIPTVRTDTTLVDVQPAPERTITLFKVGYYDTTFTMPVEAYMPNLVGVELHAITEDLNKLQSQIDFVTHRQRKWIGRGLLWSSIAPVLAGGVLAVLADRDWSKAANDRNAYQDAAFASSETIRLVKENKDLNASGDLKAKIGAGLGGLAVLTAGLGLAFQF